PNDIVGRRWLGDVADAAAAQGHDQLRLRRAGRVERRRKGKTLHAPRVYNGSGPPGGVAEWPIASVLKTDIPKGIGGSNPSPSAEYWSSVIKPCIADFGECKTKGI